MLNWLTTRVHYFYTPPTITIVVHTNVAIHLYLLWDWHEDIRIYKARNVRGLRKILRFFWWSSPRFSIEQDEPGLTYIHTFQTDALAPSEVRYCTPFPHPTYPYPASNGPVFSIQLP